MRYKHFIITRFNIRTTFDCKPKNPNNDPTKLILDSGYLKERFFIFEKYTLPSIVNQTSQNFEWILLFHKKTPKEFKQKIKQLKEKYNFIDLYFGDKEKFIFEKFIDENNYKNKLFITSRIDNDDMFDIDYTKKIQLYADKNLKRSILSFEKGLKLDIKTGKKYNFNRKDNHFISMIAPKDFYVLGYSHNKIYDSGEKIILLPTRKPMWVEIVHDTNVINHIKK